MIRESKPDVRQLALYDSLARFQWLRRRLAGAGPGERLEMHKRLAAPGNGQRPPAGHAGLHDWMWRLLDMPAAPRVLDVGCGFGATLISWARRSEGSYVGIAPSPYQLRRARQEADRCGVQCSFRLQSYDESIEGTFDRVVAVEALFHADDLHATLQNLASCIERDGLLLAVEDVAASRSVGEDVDARSLLRAWSSRSLHAREDWRDAAEGAGFEIVVTHDLSDQVEARAAAELARHERCLRLLRRGCPLAGGRRVADAFLGGIALERLYAKGAMSYLAILLRASR